MTTEPAVPPFVGANIALICRAEVLVYRRDAYDWLPFAGMWDLPGGGREGQESPTACALRELQEEFGLVLPPSALHWGRDYPSNTPPDSRAWFFAGHIRTDQISRIVFGDEGQYWRMMPVAEFLAHDAAVPHLQQRLAHCLPEAFPAGLVDGNDFGHRV